MSFRTQKIMGKIMSGIAVLALSFSSVSPVLAQGVVQVTPEGENMILVGNNFTQVTLIHIWYSPDGGSPQTDSQIAVTDGTFSHTLDSLTQGVQYSFSIHDDSTGGGQEIYTGTFTTGNQTGVNAGGTQTNAGETEVNAGTTQTNAGSTQTNAGSTNPDSTHFNFEISNPVGLTSDIPTLVLKILEIVKEIGIPIVAIMIIYAGFLYATARGDTGKLETARKTLLYTVIGAAILLGATVIAEAIRDTVLDLTA